MLNCRTLTPIDCHLRAATIACLCLVIILGKLRFPLPYLPLLRLVRRSYIVLLSVHRLTSRWRSALNMALVRFSPKVFMKLPSQMIVSAFLNPSSTTSASLDVQLAPFSLVIRSTPPKRVTPYFPARHTLPCAQYVTSACIRSTPPKHSMSAHARADLPTAFVPVMNMQVFICTRSKIVCHTSQP